MLDSHPSKLFLSFLWQMTTRSEKYTSQDLPFLLA